MFVIISNKYKALDVKAHEEMVSENVKLYRNILINKWAVEVSGKFNHGVPTIVNLEGEGWEIIC